MYDLFILKTSTVPEVSCKFLWYTHYVNWTRLLGHTVWYISYSFKGTLLRNHFVQYVFFILSLSSYKYTSLCSYLFISSCFWLCHIRFLSFFWCCEEKNVSKTDMYARKKTSIKRLYKIAQKIGWKIYFMIVNSSISLEN